MERAETARFCVFQGVIVMPRTVDAIKIAILRRQTRIMRRRPRLPAAERLSLCMVTYFRYFHTRLGNAGDLGKEPWHHMTEIC